MKLPDTKTIAKKYSSVIFKEKDNSRVTHNFNLFSKVTPEFVVNVITGISSQTTIEPQSKYNSVRVTSFSV